MGAIKDACENNQEIINDFIYDYELDADEGCYTPNEQERMLITDAIHGLLDDERFIKTFIEWQKLVKEKADMTFANGN